jgi:hypothetical protein
MIHPNSDGLMPLRRQFGAAAFNTATKVVAQAGIEPATQGFSVLCSTN